MIVVEVLDRGGRVAERVRLAALPAVIGRGYGSDVILDDPFADAAHARLVSDATGALAVEDLGSANGLYEGEHGARLTRIALAPGATFRVGHTLLRVGTPELAVPPALRDERRGSRLHRLVRQRATAVGLTLLVVPSLGLEFYLSSTDQPGSTEFAIGALTVLGLGLAWAGAWALGTRIRSGQGRFLAHLSVTWLWFAATTLVMKLDEWYRFFAGDGWTASGLSYATVTFAIILAVYGQLAIASRTKRVTRVLIGAGITVVLLGLAQITEESSHYRGIAIGMPLKPVPAALVPAQSADEFLAGVAKLQQQVDEDVPPED